MATEHENDLRLLVVLEANTIVMTILGTHIPSLTGSCMIHPGLSPLIFATTKTLQSVNGRFEPGPGPQRTTKRVSLAGSCEAAPITQERWELPSFRKHH